jgi:hypothetical protein
MPDSHEIKLILAKGRIEAADVLMLRRRVFLEGVVTPADAEMVFVLNDRLQGATDESWPPFFVEALTDYIVFQAQPRGYISEDNADWLIARVSRAGHVDTVAELELLVSALERAIFSPVRLVSFVLEQVKRGVIEGNGPVAHGGRLQPGVMGEVETELVRRILYAFGGDGNVAITRQEAEILFDINDATAEAANHPAWSDLYAKALANFLMAASGYQVPTRQEALRREAWLDAPTPGVVSFLGQMLAGSLSAIGDSYRYGTLDGEPRPPVVIASSLDDLSPRATDAEIEWAVERIRRNGLNRNERVLINFLKSLGAHMYPRLVPILDLVVA